MAPESVSYRLRLREGHLYLDAGGRLWLLETGAPVSFGEGGAFALLGESFPFGRDARGLTPRTLSKFVGVDCAGVLGADVLGRFDWVFDVPGETVTVSRGELRHEGSVLPIDEVFGFPVASVTVRDVAYRMFVDTGAQHSYFQPEARKSFPAGERATDFYLAVGRFETETHQVDVTLGSHAFTLRCGVLPRHLATALQLSGTHGVIGNAIFRQRRVGYFPRRRMLVL
jgi:hypothetical protein